MTLPVLTAGTGETWEADLVGALDARPGGLSVVRRCVDVTDLLATAAAGVARAALVSAALRRLDRDTLARLAAARVAVVGLVSPGDEAALTRLRELGVAQVLPGDAPVERVVTAVVAAVQAVDRRADPSADFGYADPAGAARAAAGAAPSGVPSPPPTPDGVLGGGPPTPPTGAPAGPTDRPAAEPGRLVAVWGPAGAPGRTTVAVTVAAEAAARGATSLLADADVYGGAVAQVLGLLDEAPGLAAAARAANQGTLDGPALARLAPEVTPRLRVLTGIARADRWPELRPSALDAVWSQARRLASLTVVDCGFCLEQDEELAYDTAAPRRNGATLATLAAADTVLAVGAADPVGMARLVRGLADLREAVPGVAPVVVLNRVRPGPVGPRPERALTEALDRYAGVRDPVLVPEDRAAVDAALLAGRALTEVARGSAARTPLAALAERLLGEGAVPARGGRRGRRGRRTA